MQVNTVNNNIFNNSPRSQKPFCANFRAKEESQEILELKEELEKSKKSRKWGVGIASACLTGLGQIINGEVGKGLAFFLGSILAGGVSLAAYRSNRTFGSLIGLASMAIPIWSIVDAVKGVDRK